VFLFRIQKWSTWKNFRKV